MLNIKQSHALKRVGLFFTGSPNEQYINVPAVTEHWFCLTASLISAKRCLPFLICICDNHGLTIINYGISTKLPYII